MIKKKWTINESPFERQYLIWMWISKRVFNIFNVYTFNWLNVYHIERSTWFDLISFVLLTWIDIQKILLKSWGTFNQINFSNWIKSIRDYKNLYNLTICCNDAHIYPNTIFTFYQCQLFWYFLFVKIAKIFCF